MNARKRKLVPRSVAVFGASGHIGGPLAGYLRFHAPNIRLRLIGTTPGKVAGLRQAYPGTEVVQASYFDQPSLDDALAGIEGLFVVTSEPTDEAPAMTNLVAAVKKADCLIHMIRIVGMQPYRNDRRLPKALLEYRLGIEIQHPIACEILNEAELPVTYLNIWASYMDNLLRTIPAVVDRGTLYWPERRMTYVDPREVGEAAARLLLSDDPLHLYQFHTLNSGERQISSGEVAQMMSEVFLRKIAWDGSLDSVMQTFAKPVELGLISTAHVAYLREFFGFMAEIEHQWVPNQFLERTLGRQPTTLRAWLQEHRRYFFPDDRLALPAGVSAPERPR
jgi:nucleoside-diphosphate-sugar epimerase